MYSTCIHCHRSLGSNELVEHFPTGQTLAFDPAKGRLWVVCRKCRRWNLTPLEERWEAIEESEKLFRGSKLKMSTDNIGLASVGGGTQLIRLGKPERREIATWRYAQDVARRWRTYGLPMAVIGGAVVMGGQVAVQPADSTLVWAASVGGVLAVGRAFALLSRRSSEMRIAMPDGQVKTITPGAAASMSLTRGDDGLWALKWNRVHRPRGGDTAIPALRNLLAVANRSGAGPKVVAEALDLLSYSSSGHNFLAAAGSAAAVSGLRRFDQMPESARIALEMALHDTIEQRSFDGELTLLSAEWEIAEEIARIADDMFLPANIMERIAAGRSNHVG